MRRSVLSETLRLIAPLFATSNFVPVPARVFVGSASSTTNLLRTSQERVVALGHNHERSLTTGHCTQQEASASSESSPSKQPDSATTTQDEFVQSLTATAGPAAYYKENRLSGSYKKDPKQESTILKLQDLYDNLTESFKSKRRRSGLTLVDHAGTAEGHHSWWHGIGNFLGDSKAAAEPQLPKVKGLYMFGGVGTGKTMLMDLLANSAPPQFKLQRMHFHDFMLDIHSKLKQYVRQQDPLLQVADASMSCTRVLCLDELFVTDVADAAILNRLFGRMWDRGLVLVATSNRAPDDLYKGGLQRELFLPFIARLKQETDVHDMASPVDYRKLAHARQGIYLTKAAGKDPEAELAQHFKELVSAAGGKPPEARQVAVQMGRTLDVPLAGDKMCLMAFSELCGKNLGAADYIALAGAFHTVSLSGVPVFDSSNRPAAYRFVTLVDILYETRVRMFCSAAGTPQELFANILSQQDAQRAQKTGKAAEMLIVDDNLAFSKDRAISRLIEMGSTEYLMWHARKHAPCLLLALEERKEANRRQEDSRLAAAA